MAFWQAEAFHRWWFWLRRRTIGPIDTEQGLFHGLGGHSQRHYRLRYRQHAIGNEFIECRRVLFVVDGHQFEGFLLGSQSMLENRVSRRLSLIFALFSVFTGLAFILIFQLCYFQGSFENCRSRVTVRWHTHIHPQCATMRFSADEPRCFHQNILFSQFQEEQRRAEKCKKRARFLIETVLI